MRVYWGCEWGLFSCGGGGGYVGAFEDAEFGFGDVLVGVFVSWFGG